MENPITEIEWVFEDKLRKTQAFNNKMNFNARLTTCVRIGGYFMMGIGLCIMFSPITYIVSLFPFFGAFLGGLTSFVFGVLVNVN